MDIEAELQARQDQHPDAYYATENPNEETTAIGRHLRHTEYHLWQQLQPDDDEDYAVAVARVQRVTGKSEHAVLNAIGAHSRIRELDYLRTLQEMTFRLDQSRLEAINEALSKLDAYEDTGTISEIDRRLAEYLIPTRKNQHLPSTGKLRRKINDWIKLLRPELDLTDSEAKKPEMEINHTDQGHSYIDITADTETAVEIDNLIRARQKEKDLSPGEALLDLLRGTSHTQIVLNLYRAHDVEDAPGFMHDPGWMSPAMTDRLAERADKVRDMDEVATKVSSAYATPDDIRAFVVGRDGTCRYPGDNRRAEGLQMDHTVDHADGGETCGNNLCALCQHHHNIKTDGRVIPIQVGGGEIVWLFDDGTWEHTEPDGPLAPKNRRWVQTVGERIAKRRANLRAPEKEDD